MGKTSSTAAELVTIKLKERLPLFQPHHGIGTEPDNVWCGAVSARTANCSVDSQRHTHPTTPRVGLIMMRKISRYSLSSTSTRHTDNKKIKSGEMSPLIANSLLPCPAGKTEKKEKRKSVLIKTAQPTSRTPQSLPRSGSAFLVSLSTCRPLLRRRLLELETSMPAILY